MLSMAIDVKNKLKNKRPIAKRIFPAFLTLFLQNDSVSPRIIIYADIFSSSSPVMKEVIVVAMLLPNMIPILLLKVKSLAFIRLMVSIITAELDCIMVVAKKPVVILLNVEDVMLCNFCFTLFKDRDIRLLLR